MINFNNFGYLFQKENVAETIEKLEDSLDNARDELTTLSDALSAKNNEIDALKLEVKNLLSIGVIDVLAVKDWYEERYGHSSWYYNFDGEGNKDAKLALTVTPAGGKALKAKAIEILKEYELENTDDPTRVVAAVIKWAASKKTGFRYVRDDAQFGKIEFWQKAEETLKTMKGDCDDLAILMHNLIYYALTEVALAEHYWRLKLTAGGTLVEGHAFNIWLADDGEWYAVESTLDLLGSYKKTWLITPIKNNNLYTGFWGFVRKDRSWVGSYSALKRYEEVK